MGSFASAESDPAILDRADAIRIWPARLQHLRLEERCEIRDLVEGAVQCHAHIAFRSYRRNSATWVKTMLFSGGGEADV